MASVELLYADTLEMVRKVIAPDGVFEFFHIPEENFVLRAAAGNDAPPNLDLVGSPNAAPGLHHITWAYPQAGEGSPEIPLQVTGDIENLAISVPDPVPNKKGPLIEFDSGGSSGVWSMKQIFPN